MNWKFELILNQISEIKFIRIFYVFSLILLVCSCSRDGVTDNSIDDMFVREAMCVVAAERFHLYDAAKEHYEHGLDRIKEIVRTQPEKALKTNYHENYKKYLNEAVTFQSKMSKNFSASFLMEQCDSSITNGEFEHARY